MIAAVGISLILDIDFRICLATFTAVAILYTGKRRHPQHHLDRYPAGHRLHQLRPRARALCRTIHRLAEHSRRGRRRGPIPRFPTRPGRCRRPFGLVERRQAAAHRHRVRLPQHRRRLRHRPRHDPAHADLQGCPQCAAQRPAQRLYFDSHRPPSSFSSASRLYAYYQVHGSAGLPLLPDGSIAADKVFPWFIGTELPAGLRGLLLVGVPCRRHVQPRFDHGRAQLLRPCRPLPPPPAPPARRPPFAAAFPQPRLRLRPRPRPHRLGPQGCRGLSLAYVPDRQRDLRGASRRLPSGHTDRSRSDRGNLIAMLSAGAVCAVLLALIRLDWIALGWTWLILIGTAWTFGLGFCWRGREVARP